MLDVGRRKCIFVFRYRNSAMYHYPEEDPSFHVLSPMLGSDQEKGSRPDCVSLSISSADPRQ